MKRTEERMKRTKKGKRMGGGGLIRDEGRRKRVERRDWGDRR